ncbi:hypothetical protein Trydic_g2861 [Trypoxylus dichotomus]
MIEVYYQPQVEIVSHSTFERAANVRDRNLRTQHDPTLVATVTIPGLNNLRNPRSHPRSSRSHLPLTFDVRFAYKPT